MVKSAPLPLPRRRGQNAGVTPERLKPLRVRIADTLANR
jgi:hypothetical protein